MCFFNLILVQNLTGLRAPINLTELHIKSVLMSNSFYLICTKAEDVKIDILPYVKL